MRRESFWPEKTPAHGPVVFFLCFITELADMLRSVLSLLLLGSAAAFSPAFGSLAARRHTPAARMMFGGGDKKDGDGNFMDKLKVRASPRLQQPHTRTRRPFPRHVSRSHAALRRRQRTCSTPR